MLITFNFLLSVDTSVLALLQTEHVCQVEDLPDGETGLPALLQAARTLGSWIEGGWRVLRGVAGVVRVVTSGLGGVAWVFGVVAGVLRVVSSDLGDVAWVVCRLFGVVCSVLVVVPITREGVVVDVIIVVWIIGELVSASEAINDICWRLVFQSGWLTGEEREGGAEGQQQQEMGEEGEGDLHHSSNKSATRRNYSDW